MAVAPARHVATRRLQRDLTLPRAQSGSQFDLHVLRRGALGGGKVRDIVMRPGDIVFEGLRHARSRASMICTVSVTSWAVWGGSPGAVLSWVKGMARISFTPTDWGVETHWARG